MSNARIIAHLSRRWTFVAAHRLHVDALSVEDNLRVFGKCNNPFGHGHNYVVEATFAGPIDKPTGMVTNLRDVDEFAQRELIERFDHQNLNMLECFRDRVPTTENLCLELWEIFVAYPYADLVRIRVEETGNNSFEYSGRES